jgi:hypothetical protein
MKWNDYQLATYTDEDIEEILALIGTLWGNDTSFNRQYFIWKHRMNPFLRRNIGIVARFAGRVIGFLGYVPAEYKIGNNSFMTLQQSDTVVHPEYRGKGLFSVMSKTGLQMYGGEYKYIVNFTSNYMTAGGLLKLGWLPLANVQYLRRLNWLNIIRNRFLAGRSALKPGRSGDIEVSAGIRSPDITAAGLANCYVEEKICLNKTPQFLDWRLSNPRNKYLCLYYLPGSDTEAYVVVRIKNNHAHVFDYGQKKGSSGVQRLFDFIIKHARFDSVSFLDSTTPEELKPFLRNNRFWDLTRIDKIRHGRSYAIPVIIRPAVEKYTEDDWYIGEVDARDADNWHITEMCFD